METGQKPSLTHVRIKCAQRVFLRFCTFVMMFWPLLSQCLHMYLWLSVFFDKGNMEQTN